MGVAIIINGVDFSAPSDNIGQIAFKQEVDLTGLEIVCNSTINGMLFKPTVNFIPVNAMQRTVVWSLSSGDSYASIDSATGEVTINSSAMNSTITIKATSTFDSSIYAEKTVTISYREPFLKSAIPGFDITDETIANGDTPIAKGEGNGVTYSSKDIFYGLQDIVGVRVLIPNKDMATKDLNVGKYDKTTHIFTNIKSVPIVQNGVIMQILFNEPESCGPNEMFTVVPTRGGSSFNNISVQNHILHNLVAQVHEILGGIMKQVNELLAMSLNQVKHMHIGQTTSIMQAGYQ